MKQQFISATLLLFLAVSVQAAPKTKLLALLASDAVLILGTYLDMQSSLDARGKFGPHGGMLFETNPLFRSGPDRGFHKKGVIGIWAITGGMIAAEHLAYRKYPYEASGIGCGTNLLFGGLHAMAAHNNRKLIAGGEQWLLNNPQ